MNRIELPTSFALFLLALGVHFGGPAFASQEEEAASADEEEEADAEEDEKEERWFAITGGDVYTGTGAILRSATILSHNGIIEQIGYELYIPEEAELLDARGMRVYPGMVALSASSRLTSGLFSSQEPSEPGERAGEEGPGDPHYGLDDWIAFAYGDRDRDGDEAGVGTPSHVELDDYDPAWGPADADIAVEDSFDAFSQYLVLALATGITSAEQSGTAVKLKRGEIDDVVMNDKNLKTLSWATSNPTAIQSLRDKFGLAAGYLRKLRVWEALSEKERKVVKEPKKPRGFDNTAFEILRGISLARFNINNRADILGVARFAQEFGFRPVIWGCLEGWTVAEELGRAGSFAVLSPRARSPKHESLRRAGGSSIENAAILHRHGVQVAIVPENTNFDMSGITGRDLMHLPVEAAFGVRGGLSEEAAFAAISLVPARLLGVDHRIGTLEPGKDMDAIVTDGDILHYQTFVQWTVVAGKLSYDKQEELFFAHIRPRPERPSPSATTEESTAAEDSAEPDAGTEDGPETEKDAEKDAEGDEPDPAPEEGEDEG